MRQIEQIREYGKILAVKNARDLARDPDRLAAYMQRYQHENPNTEVPEFQEFRSLLEDVEKHFTLSMNKRSAMLLSLLSTWTAYEQFLTMTWLLMRVPPSVELATGDAPVVSFFSKGQGLAMFGGGLSLPGVEVSFPLNPSTCLFLHRHKPDVEILPNEAFTREMNNRITRNAERFVISRRQSPQIENAVKKFSYTRQQPKLNKAEILKRHRHQ